jgi:hypothetical protein
MNTYSKFIPNVWLAKCGEPHQKGDIIEVTTQYGKENECIIPNLIYERDGFFFYSIVRSDGFNSQERARKRAERYNQYATSAEKKSEQYYEASNKDKDFLSLGEPIKVGHHSERRHRKAFEDAHRNMGKCVELSNKAESYEQKAAYWANRANTINLSMPESLEFFTFQLEKAKEYHDGLKSGKYERSHSFSLTYAKKEVNELQKKYEFAQRLWG